MTDEENTAIVKAEVKAHFAPKKPVVKEKLDPKVIQHFVDLVEQPASHVLHRPSDYDRCIDQSFKKRQRTKSSTASMKQVPQLGEQKNQSIPPLKVLSDAELRVAAIATSQGLTVDQMRGLEEIPKAELAWKYVYGQPLVRPDKIPQLPTQMRRLHDWYMKVAKEERKFIMVKVKMEHYYREDLICIEIDELFQLFNQDALDKSLVSSYCL
jgi:hypothetical protein